ncbi:MAG: alpha/beta fold hydrolase [Acidimicrobiia bacterium]
MELIFDGRLVEVEIQGKGPPLLLIHSLLTDPAAFDLILPGLTPRHTVCRVSLPGFGKSSVLDDPSIEDLADWVAGVLETLELGPDGAVLGNGLGGFVAVALAFRHGPLFDRLIATNCGAVFSPQRSEAFHTMSRMVEEEGMEAVVNTAVRRIFPTHYVEQTPSVVEERRRVLLTVDPRAFAAACRALAAMDLRPYLPKIDNPTLVVVGADDETTPPDMAADLANGIRSASQVTLEDCGHCPQLQQPGALVEVIRTFLDD